MKEDGNGRQLWNRIDKLRGSMSIRELSERTGILEGSLQTTRSLGTLPKMQMLYPIAQALGTTVEYLYTGIEENEYSDNPVFRKISSSQLLFDIVSKLADATPEEIEVVRRVLDVDKPKSMS